MTTLTLHAVIGKQLRIRTSFGLDVDVTVIDSKQSWNKIRLLVRPLAGDGQTWIEPSRVEMVLNSDGRPEAGLNLISA